MTCKHPDSARAELSGHEIWCSDCGALYYASGWHLSKVEDSQHKAGWVWENVDEHFSLDQPQPMLVAAFTLIPGDPMALAHVLRSEDARVRLVLNRRFMFVDAPLRGALGVEYSLCEPLLMVPGMLLHIQVEPYGFQAERRLLVKRINTGEAVDWCARLPSDSVYRVMSRSVL